MDESEVFAMVVSILLSAVLWVRWFLAQLQVLPLRRRLSNRWLGYFVPLLAGRWACMAGCHGAH